MSVTTVVGAALGGRLPLGAQEGRPGRWVGAQPVPQ